MFRLDGRGEAELHRIGYHEYDPHLCFAGEVEYAVAEYSLEIEVSEGTLVCRRIGAARFTHAGQTASLDLFWLDIYGGGLWLPVGDQTNGETTYRGGRYLYDTTKGANLGWRSTAGASCSISTSSIRPPARSTTPGYARSARRPTGYRSSWKLESELGAHDARSSRSARAKSDRESTTC